MDLKEICERSQALQLEFLLLKTELKNYGNAHATEINAVDGNYLYKANQYQGDITPARLARVSNKLMYPSA